MYIQHIFGISHLIYKCYPWIVDSSPQKKQQNSWQKKQFFKTAETPNSKVFPVLFSATVAGHGDRLISGSPQLQVLQLLLVLVGQRAQSAHRVSEAGGPAFRRSLPGHLKWNSYEKTTDLLFESILSGVL